MVAQSSLSSGGQTTAGRVSLPPLPLPPATDQEQFLPYWTTEPGWASEIQLRNDQAGQDLTVTPVLRSSNGAETNLLPITVKPHEAVIADVATALASVAPQLIGGYGSVVMRYKAPTEASLFSMAMIRGVGKPIALHIDSSSQLTSYQTGSREGIWWLPASATSDYLILTNEGQSQLLLGLSLYDASGKGFLQHVALAPGAMARYSVRQLVAAGGLSGSYGGITISAAQNAGSLDTLHFLYNRNAGFSALLKMYDHDASTTLAERDFAKTGSWTLHAPMLALSVPGPVLEFPAGTALQPQLLIRNATAKPLDANLSFEWKRGAQTGGSAGPSLSLGPYQTQNVDVAVLQRSGAVPMDANWAAVKLTTNGNPGDIMAIASSYDKTLKYGAQTPFSDQLASHWVGSVWEYDATHDSIITVGNGGAKPTQAAFTLNYNHGTGAYEIDQLLQPDQQMWIDVGQLIRNQIPDKNGNTLPSSLAMGSYEIRELTRHAGGGSLFEGKVVYDKKYGSVTYGCGSCCAYKTVKFYFVPLGVPLDGFADQGVEVIDTCSGTWVDITSDFDNSWSTANQSVATVDAYGTHAGVANGTTTTRASAEEQVWYKLNDCPILPMTPQGGDNVAPPMISSISPSEGPVTQTVFGVTISGSGFGNSPTVDAGSGISIDIVSANDTQIQANFQIASTATPGNHSVTVTNGQTSNGVNFFVQVPTSIAVINTVSSGPNSCSNGMAGWKRVVTLQLRDQNNQPMSYIFQVADQIVASGQNSCALSSFNVGSTFTDSTGSWTDTYSFCSSVCVTTTNCETDATQTWTANGVTLTQPNRIAYQCSQITVNGQ